MKRAFLVYGPESSGNRLMTRILVACGCYGDGAHRQRLNDWPPPPDIEQIAWHRSVPYGGAWPNLQKQTDMVRQAGFYPTVLIMTRDWCATAMSQLHAPHVPDIDTGYEHIELAYLHIFGAVIGRGLPYVMVSYEALQRREYLDWLLSHLGLEPQQEIEAIRDENEKWYEGIGTS